MSPHVVQPPLGWVPFIYISACGVVVHAIFKHYEPSKLALHGFFILVLPTSLSALLIPHLNVAKAVATAAAVYHVSLLTSIALYRLSPFHPYARYPGPVACKLSKIWLAWVSSYGRQHTYIQSLHEQYGDVVRIGPNEISIRDVSAINALMGTHGLPKGPNWSGRTLHTPHPSVIAMRDPQAHFLRRKSWNRALNMGAIKEYQPRLAARVAQLAERVAAQPGETDLAEWIGYFTYDFMSDMAFGGGSEMLRDGDSEGMLNYMARAAEALLWLDHLPWLAYYARQFQRAAGPIVDWRRAAKQRIENRQRGGSVRRDVMYSLSNEDINKEPPPSDALVNDGILVIAAGSDTTSSVLSNAFYFLLSNHDVYDRLQKEIDHFYPLGEDSLDAKHYPKMPYLDAVINETLRLMPAVMSGSQRAPLPGSGGKVVGKYFVPEGNQARIHFFSVHRDPRNFTDPARFWPERWLVAEGLQPCPPAFTHNADAFVPFSHGPANCVGKPLAMHEMRTVLCHVVQRLELEFAPGWDARGWEREIEDRFVVNHGRLLVVARARG